MADQSLSFDSINLDATLSTIDRAEADAAKFIAAHKELELQFRLRPATAAAEALLRGCAALALLTPSALAETLRSLAADVVAVVGWMDTQLVLRGVAKTTREARVALIGKIKASGAPAVTLTEACAAYGALIA